MGQGQAGNGGVAGSKQGNAEPVDQFAGLPSVPSLHGLDLKGIRRYLPHYIFGLD